MQLGLTELIIIAVVGILTFTATVAVISNFWDIIAGIAEPMGWM